MSKMMNFVRFYTYLYYTNGTSHLLAMQMSSKLLISIEKSPREQKKSPSMQLTHPRETLMGLGFAKKIHGVYASA